MTSINQASNQSRQQWCDVILCATNWTHELED